MPLFVDETPTCLKGISQKEIQQYHETAQNIYDALIYKYRLLYPFIMDDVAYTAQSYDQDAIDLEFDCTESKTKMIINSVGRKCLAARATVLAQFFSIDCKANAECISVKPYDIVIWSKFQAYYFMQYNLSEDCQSPVLVQIDPTVETHNTDLTLFFNQCEWIANYNKNSKCFIRRKLGDPTELSVYY